MGSLITAAAAANSSIRQVQALEEELKLNIPYLTTSYRVLACRFLFPRIIEICAYLRGIGKSVPISEVTAFVGDAIEGLFRFDERIDDSDVVRKFPKVEITF
jgi:hypothetical protein